MNNLVKVLMDREVMSEHDVVEWIDLAASGWRAHPDHTLEVMLYEEFGVEPDYLFDLIEFL